MSETTDAPKSGGNDAGEEGKQEQGKAFTQSDVDRIVQERLAQQAKNKFGDYDDLKSKAAGAATSEERIAELEKKYTEAETARLRSDIATKHSISAEDRDLFLTGSDESTLTAQAKRLAAREADRKKQGNVAPREGTTNTNYSPKDAAKREWLRSVTGADAN